MQLDRIRRAVGTFPTRAAAEQALTELRDSGFPMDRVSVVAKDATQTSQLGGAEVSDRVGNKADDGAKAGAVSGGALGGLTGLLVGLGALAIPGLGPVMLAGAGATVIATALSGTAIGSIAGGLLGALVGLGIPEERAKGYHDRIAQGDYLVMVEGTDPELDRAEAVLAHRGIEGWGVYEMPNATQSPTVSPTVAPVMTPVVDRAPLPTAQDADSIRLYEERLLVDKKREKAGEVAIGKHIETEVERVSIPVEKERIVIERVAPNEVRTVAASEANFQDGEVVRMEVYEEAANISKEAFVREEVNLRKEVDRETLNVEETIRREELDVEVQGNPVISRTIDKQSDRI